MHPSDAIPLRLYAIIKAHRLEENYPLRTTVPEIETVPFGISKYLVGITQLALNKNELRVINSASLLSKAQDEAQSKQNTTMHSHYVTAAGLEQTHNHLVCKLILNYLAKLAKYLTCVVSTYLYAACECMFASCHLRV